MRERKYNINSAKGRRLDTFEKAVKLRVKIIPLLNSAVQASTVLRCTIIEQFL